MSTNTRGPSNLFAFPEFVLTGVLSIKNALKGTKKCRINESLLLVVFIVLQGMVKINKVSSSSNSNN